jgi:hypothetical protein
MGVRQFSMLQFGEVPARSSEVIRSGRKFKSEIFDFASAAV